jgi:ankyrin repeat protein
VVWWSAGMKYGSDTWNPQAPGAELFDAVERNDLAAVEELLLRGADVNSLDPRCPPYACPALMAAACRGYSDMVRLLLANGADVNARDVGGGTALLLVPIPTSVTIPATRRMAASWPATKNWCGWS